VADTLACPFGHFRELITVMADVGNFMRHDQVEVQILSRRPAFPVEITAFCRGSPQQQMSERCENRR
jgi:hypothetical protein